MGRGNRVNDDEHSFSLLVVVYFLNKRQCGGCKTFSFSAATEEQQPGSALPRPTELVFMCSCIYVCVCVCVCVKEEEQVEAVIVCGGGATRVANT